MNNYSKVLPRDLFNEAKLLKDLGFLTLRIHNGNAPKWLSFELIDNRKFEICQDQSTGDLYVRNLTVRAAGKPIYLYHPYNQKTSPSLRFRCEDFEGPVFEVSKSFSEDFIELLLYCQHQQINNND